MHPRQPSRQNSVNSPCQPLHSVPICRTRSTGGSGSSMKVWARQLNFSGRCRSLAGAFLKTFVKNLILRYQVLLSATHTISYFFFRCCVRTQFHDTSFIFLYSVRDQELLFRQSSWWHTQCDFKHILETFCSRIQSRAIEMKRQWKP